MFSKAGDADKSSSFSAPAGAACFQASSKHRATAFVTVESAVTERATEPLPSFLGVRLNVCERTGEVILASKS